MLVVMNMSVSYFWLKNSSQATSDNSAKEGRSTEPLACLRFKCCSSMPFSSGALTLRILSLHPFVKWLSEVSCHSPPPLPCPLHHLLPWFTSTLSLRVPKGQPCALPSDAPTGFWSLLHWPVGFFPYLLSELVLYAESKFWRQEPHSCYKNH